MTGRQPLRPRRSAATPTLDRLAAEGVRFDDAVSSVPLTLPSHATILNSKVEGREWNVDCEKSELRISLFSIKVP